MQVCNMVVDTINNKTKLYVNIFFKHKKQGKASNFNDPMANSANQALGLMALPTFLSNLNL